MIRTDKENYYLDIAETVAERGTCLRRNFGAIIVHNDEIVSTGYNGAPRTVSTWAFVFGRSWAFPVESDMRSAVLFMQRQTQLSALPAGI